jgi:hypothetical protein
MQAARASAIWYGHSMLTRVDKVPLISRGDAREPDAGRWAALTGRGRWRFGLATILWHP